MNAGPAGGPPPQEEVSSAAGPNTSGAAAGVAMRAYQAEKRSMVVWSLILAVPLSLVVAAGSVLAAVALGAGVLCGIGNSLLSMRANERLVDHRSVATFVLSSVLRIFVFGIVPVGFALHGPWSTLAAYFIGFFTPLVLYAFRVARAARTS